MWEGEDNSLKLSLSLEDKESGYLLQNSKDILMEMKWEREEKKQRIKEYRKYFGGRK